MKKGISKEIYNRLLKKFWDYMLIYTVILVGVAILGIWYCNKRIWHSYDPFYPLLKWIDNNLISVILGLLLLGGMILACYQLYSITGLMEKITDGVNMVYKGNGDLVELPEEIKEIEQQLNHIMTDVQNSRFAAKQAQQQKNDMIMYMAHDLKTPLTSVIGYITILQEEKELSENIKKKYLSIVSDKAYRLEELINEFFEVTRYNFSHISLELSKVNISRMVEQIVSEFTPMFSEKGLKSEVDIDQDIYLMCDVNQIERVFDNLLKNVFNYSYKDSTVNISVKTCDEATVKIVIENKGKTIPQEKLEHIFEQFYRLDSSRDSRTGGTGLGLAIAKEIIELHKGTINCTSQDETIWFEVIL